MKPYLTLSVSIGLLYSSMFALAEPTPIYEINSAETFIQAPLDHEIYFYSRSSELNDLQVQDAQGNNLPFRILDATAQSKTLQRETPAVFFPVDPNTSEEMLRTLSSTSIYINTDKVQVDIIESSAKPDVNSAAIDSVILTPEFYLVDLTSFQKKSVKESGLKLNALRLTSKTTGDNVIPYQTWELSVSNDLHNWSLISHTSLVQLYKEGDSLIQDKIPLNIDYQDYAYLKLRCTEFCSSVQLSTVSILEESTTQFFPSDTHWKLKGKAASSKAIKLDADNNWPSVTAWEFIRQDLASIEHFSIDLGAQIYGDKIRLLGRSRSQDAWNLLYQGIWFKTKVGNQWYESGPQALSGHDYSEFRLELAGQVQANHDIMLVFHTHSRLVQFIGNETPPYKLVVDSGNLSAQARILDSLLNNQSPDWVNHQWTFLNLAKPEAITSISWRSLVFWGLLAIAVMLLALMAIKLFKQMNTQVD